MSRIFISYSRSDIQFVDELVPLLAAIFTQHVVWYDDRIVGGEDWWQRILREISTCDLFIYLLSDESLESPYCQAEFREALRLHKRCLPVIVRPKTDVSRTQQDLEAELRRRNWVDMSAGFKDERRNAKLWNAVNISLSDLPAETAIPITSAPILTPPVTNQQNRSISRYLIVREAR